MGFFGGQAQAAATPWFSDANQELVGNNVGTTLTASSTPHTKGAWTQLIASTTEETTLLAVGMTTVAITNTDTATLLDIGVGASGSESAIVSNIAVGSANAGATGADGLYFFIPIKIASGSRISARIQSVVASRSGVVTVFAYKFSSSSLIPTSADVIGTSTATSEGTTLSASNAWTQIISATSQDYSAIILLPSLSDAAVASSLNFTMDVGIGASGSEVVIGTSVGRVFSTEGIAIRTVQYNLIGREIASGTRIAVRQSTALTTLDACIIGIPKV